MTFSVVDFGAYGLYQNDDHDFSYSGLSDGDLLILTSVADQGLATWAINGNFLNTNGILRDYKRISAPTGGVWDADIYVMQYYGGSEPSSGTLRASTGLGIIGGAQYFILHDSEGPFGQPSDYLGIDLPAIDTYGASGLTTGSHALSKSSRAAAFGGQQLELALVAARFITGTIVTSTISPPSSMTSSQGMYTSASDHVVGLGAYELAAAGTVPARSSTVSWSFSGAGSHGVDAGMTTPVVYFAPRHHVTVHKTIVPNVDSYSGPAATTDFTVEVLDNTPSGFPDFGPFALWIGVDGNDFRLPDNDIYINGDGSDNAGADWGGFESGITDYIVSNVTGDGGNVIVTWTSGQFFTVQVNGDGDLYFENTYTGTTPVTPTGDYWGIQSADY